MNDPGDPSTVPAAPPGPAGASGAAGASGYRVLARTYRPATFAELIGQDTLVRTLSNAILSGRVAHAFILTGVRGVGKTTTARILARALNCTRPDGSGGPTPEPCGQCDNCRAIAEDRHVDVLEMDAASRTGIGDIREIIDSVRYAPVSARYKIYIIDEIHMLSQNAFNGLLKTLEEPPAQVKFIFATTEIRRVPVTVLSRCQRFDLRRVDRPLLESHFAAIAEKEQVTVEAPALSLIARAADGSVRDGLSLLDQAIALSDGPVTADLVVGMLGLADRGRLFDLYGAVIGGDAEAALAVLADLQAGGSDPLAVVQDLLEITHFLSRARLVSGVLDDPAVPEMERTQGGRLAERLDIGALQRLWQMLLKGLQEVQAAPRPAQALEMLVIRLIHAAGLPTPGDALKRLKELGAFTDAAPAAPPSGVHGAASEASTEPLPPPPPSPPEPSDEPGLPLSAASPPADAPAEPEAPPENFPALVGLFERHGDTLTYARLMTGVHLVAFRPGRLEIRLKSGMPPGFIGDVSRRLLDWTGQPWMITLSEREGEPTLREQERAAEERARDEAAAHPLVRAVLETFPGAHVQALHDLAPADAGEPEPLAPSGDDEPGGEAEAVAEDDTEAAAAPGPADQGGA